MKLWVASDPDEGQDTLPVADVAPAVADVVAAADADPLGPVAAARRAEAVTGSPVAILPVDLNLVRAAMQDGVLVTTRMRKWCPTVRLTPRDLGLATAEEIAAAKRQTTQGSVRLLPADIADAFAAADTKIRRSAREHGFRIEGYRGHFVPSKCWPEFKRAFLDGQADFDRAVAALCENLPKQVASLERQIGTLVPRAWLGHRPVWTEGHTVEPGRFAHVDEPTEMFREEFVLHFTSAVPTAEIIRDACGVSYDLCILHVPEVAAAVDVARGQVQLQDELRRNLSAQGESLPRRFVEAVVRSVLDDVATVHERLVSARPTKGSGARSMTAIRELAVRCRDLNLTRDPRIEDLVATMEREIRTAEARAAGAQVHLEVEILAGIVDTCRAGLARLTTDEETA